MQFITSFQIWVLTRKCKQNGTKTHTKYNSESGLSRGTIRKTHLFCKSCKQRKQIKTSFKYKDVSTTRSLQLFHMDLFGPTRMLSLGGKKYGFVMIDDYSSYTWVYSLAFKHESFKVFEILCKWVQNEKHFCISSIKSDHGTKFVNAEFISLYERNGIFLNFSLSRTPQQNVVVEKKNRSWRKLTS